MELRLNASACQMVVLTLRLYEPSRLHYRVSNIWPLIISVMLTRLTGMPRCSPNTRSDFLNINDRLFEVLGSTTNREPFRLLSKEMNGMKGRIFKILPDGRRVNPVDPTTMSNLIDNSIRTGQNEELWLNPMRMVFSPHPIE
jgi:hypothetical protein